MMKTTKIMNSLVLMLMAGLFALSGCSQPAKETPSFISIEKPPIKVLYLDTGKKMTPEIIREIFNQVGRYPYQNYKFNDKVIVDIDGNRNFHESDTNVKTRNASVSINK